MFKTTWKHIRRSPYQSLAALGIMTLTLFVGLIFFFSALQSQAILSYFEDKPQLTVFFTDQKKTEEIKTLAEKLKKSDKVSSVKYISKEEALAIYKEQNKKDPLLLEMVTASILPASLDISAKDPQFLNDINKILRKETGVEEVVYQKDIVDLLVSWTKNLRIAGFILVSLLLGLSLLVMITIIGIKIALRKEEIEILRLIGAAKWYIRWPFLFEGALYGLVSALISWTVGVLVFFYLNPYLSTFLSGVLILSSSPLFMLIVLGGLVLTGVLIGIFGSLLAVWRYLRA